MRVSISKGVLKHRPELENQLWNIGCYAKEIDPDIKLMGLHVRVIKARNKGHWYGWAHPEEESTHYRKKLIHPAGRIDLSIGESVSDIALVRLFAHELRHIGQFHRGRKLRGYLTCEYMKDGEVEPDCYRFEDDIVRRYRRSHCRGKHDRLHTEE